MRPGTSKNIAGILVPAFALTRENDLGIGDTKAVKEAIDFCAANRIAVLQLLPINETGGDNSPYNAISAQALDPALLTVASDTVPGLTEEKFQQLTQAAKSANQRSSAIDYPQVKKLKLSLLHAAFTNFTDDSASASAEQKDDFEGFKRDNKDWLEHYALFRTLVDEHGGNACWTAWDTNVKDPASAADWLLKSGQADRLNYSCQFWSFVQWLAAKQWSAVKTYAEAANVLLMGDIPFGVSRYSADVWANQPLFDLDWCGGAPPESFFQGDQFTKNWGQNWGIPLYDWQAHRRLGFAWWRRRIQLTVRYFHYFRIDHVLGFFRIYAFPWLPEHNQEFTHLSKEEVKAKTGGRLPQFLPRDDYPAKMGELNRAQGQELLTMIIDAAGSSGVVAEDLGTVPDYVRPLLKDLGIPGFSIPIFERLPDRNFKPKESLPPLNLCTYGTHDHEPLASYYDHLVSWWHGPNGHEGWLEVQRLMRFLGLNPTEPPTEYTETLQYTFLKTLLESPCWLAVFMITDLLGTKQRFNEPGLSGDYNWSQRLDRPLGQYDKDERYAQRISYFSNLIGETNRAPSPNGKGLK